jgi:alpha-galactosidase
MYVDYVVNLYWILAELRRRFPKLEIESCAGGGGRVDLGIMTLTEQVWPSDNTDPFDRLRIQDGFSYAYSPGVMMAWVTDSPSWVNQRSTSLEYRFLSSMQGCLGLGANLNNWQSAEFAMAKRLIAEYKTIRPTIQQGDLYRLVSPQGNSGHSATLSVSPDRKQAAMFVFLHSSQNFAAMPLIPLRGLDSRRRYGMRAFCGKPDDATPSVASGAYWMEHGIAAALRGDFQCAGFVFEALS